jgi:microsomal dipeptidase-like Zn-dependent dipeptidase
VSHPLAGTLLARATQSRKLSGWKVMSQPQDMAVRLTRRGFLAFAGAVAMSGFSGCALGPKRSEKSIMTMPQASDKYLQQARQLHQRLPIFIGYFDSCDEPFMASGGRQADLEKEDASGIRFFVASIGFGCYFQIGPNEYALAGDDQWLLKRQLERMDYLLNNIAKCPRTRLVRTKKDLEVRDDKSIGVILHLTGNNHTLDLGTVDLFFQKGLRATHPGMQYHNRWVGGNTMSVVNGKESPVLTDFGRQVIARMNQLGIEIDTAHMSDESAIELIKTSTKPISDSHTCSRDLVPGIGPRGHSDAVLKMIADSGGVVGIHYADAFLTQRLHADRPPGPRRSSRQWAYNRYVLAKTQDPDQRVKLRKGSLAQAEMAKFYRDNNLLEEPTTKPATHPRPRSTVNDMADHIEYLVKVCGIDHVAHGGDVNGIDDDSWPLDMKHVGELPILTAELLRRGWTEEQLEKFLYRNWLRVFQETLPA